MRISDWSSDVCSSDLAMAPVLPHSSRQSTRRGQRVIRRTFNYRKVPYAEMRAFSVHLLTASGSFLAFLGVVAAAESRFIDMFWWLGLALAVDGIDGPTARTVGVKDVLPNWSGDTLDTLIRPDERRVGKTSVRT